MSTQNCEFETLGSSQIHFIFEISEKLFLLSYDPAREWVAQTTGLSGPGGVSYP